MDARRSILGEIGIRDGRYLSHVEVGTLVRRLLLFDRTVVKSFRLREIPLLIRVFGRGGFSKLLDSGLLEFSCGFTTLAVDFQRGGVRSVPLNHFTFGIVSAANPDADLKSELAALQSIPGLKNTERARFEESIWRSLKRQPSTYGADLLNQVDNDVRNNTPALRESVIEQLKAESVITPEQAIGISLRVEEPAARTFHLQTEFPQSFGLSAERTHSILQRAVSAVANLNQRLCDMQTYSAMVGFRDTEAPLLFGKLAGLIAPLNPQISESQFERVIEIANIPDFAPGQKINVELLLKVRDSAECREFREWLPTLTDRSDSEIQEAISGIRAKMGSLASSRSGKLVRLAATTGIGAIPGVGLVAGAVAGAVDSFLVDKVLPKSGIVAFLTETYPSLFVSP